MKKKSPNKYFKETMFTQLGYNSNLSPGIYFSQSNASFKSSPASLGTGYTLV